MWEIIPDLGSTECKTTIIITDSVFRQLKITTGRSPETVTVKGHIKSEHFGKGMEVPGL